MNERDNQTIQMPQEVSEAFASSYKKQANSEMPDLWARIDAGFDEQYKEIEKEKKKRNIRMAGVAAAMILAILLAVPVMMRNSIKNSKSEMEDVTEASMDDAADSVMEAADDDMDFAEAAEEAVEGDDRNHLQEAGANDVGASDETEGQIDDSEVTFQYEDVVCLSVLKLTDENIDYLFDFTKETEKAPSVLSCMKENDMLQWQEADDGDWMVIYGVKSGDTVIRFYDSATIYEGQTIEERMQTLVKIIK